MGVSVAEEVFLQQRSRMSYGQKKKEMREMDDVRYDYPLSCEMVKKKPHVDRLTRHANRP